MPNLSDKYFEEFIENKKEVTFTLLGNEKITGTIKQKGRFALVVEVEGRPVLLFKHAIHSLELPKTWTLEDQKIHEEAERIGKLSPEDGVKELKKSFKKFGKGKSKNN